MLQINEFKPEMFSYRKKHQIKAFLFFNSDHCFHYAMYVGTDNLLFFKMNKSKLNISGL